MSATLTFSERVWKLTEQIPAGKVATYGDLARRLKTRGVRAVGGALHRNPFAPRVPCHRVVGSDGSLTGYAGGLEKKTRMLRAEGVAVENGRVDLCVYRWRA